MVDKKICPKCKEPHEKSGMFCSRICANSRMMTEEKRLKISESCKNSEKVKSANSDNRLKGHSFQTKPENLLVNMTKSICPVCQKEIFNRYRKKKYHKECWRSANGGYREGSGRSKHGRYKGIYCGSTYELCWVIYNLDHNISFERFPGFLENEKVKYIPDFLLQESNTIIEIKGYVSDEEKLQAKIDLAKEKGFEIKILYKEDLKDCFEYVRKNYSEDFPSLYDKALQA